MTGSEIEVPVEGGVLTGLDFGGDGTPVLLVHGTGHNAAAWIDVAAHLDGRCHALAVDLRGHGRTEIGSTDAEQYWRDLGRVVTALGWDHPVLVGHSTGGYAVTAAAADGLVTPAALCVVDGLVLDDRDASMAAHADLRSPEAIHRMRTLFHYGWHADPAQKESHIQQAVREADSDWLNAGARPELVEQVMRRAFLRRGSTWVRRPSAEEVVTTTDVSPEARVLPSLDVYDRVTCPLTVVLPDQGFYAARRAEVQAVVDAGPERRLVDIAAPHNVPMTRPAELAAVVLDLARR